MVSETILRIPRGHTGAARRPSSSSTRRQINRIIVRGSSPPPGAFSGAFWLAPGTSQRFQQKGQDWGLGKLAFFFHILLASVSLLLLHHHPISPKCPSSLASPMFNNSYCSITQKAAWTEAGKFYSELPSFSQKSILGTIISQHRTRHGLRLSLKMRTADFPGGPAVERFQLPMRGHRVQSWSGK